MDTFTIYTFRKDGYHLFNSLQHKFLYVLCVSQCEYTHKHYSTNTSFTCKQTKFQAGKVK